MQLSRARHQVLSAESQELEQRSRSSRGNRFKSVRAQMKVLAERMQQWVPISRFLTIVAIIDTDQQGHSVYARGNESVMHSLAKFWAPIFNWESFKFDSEIAHSVLAEHAAASEWDWTDFQVPTCTNINNLIQHSQDNAPGFDGLAYSAHNSTSGISTVLMQAMLTSMRHFSPLSPQICLNSITSYSAVFLGK